MTYKDLLRELRIDTDLPGVRGLVTARLRVAVRRLLLARGVSLPKDAFVALGTYTATAFTPTEYHAVSYHDLMHAYARIHPR